MLSEIEACIPALRRYALALVQSRQDADDLVHDCILRALERLHTRRTDVEMRIWLFAIMHNLFVSQLRKLARRRRAEACVGGEVDPATMPIQEDQLQWRDLMSALNSLPDDQRTALLLVSIEELSYAEVAHVLGVPIGTVMSRLARGRERLRQLTDHRRRPALRRVQ